jgi:hypothetical protein
VSAGWRGLEAAAPELARLGRARLEEAGVALLGTLRPDGSPRISPVEPYLSQGWLLFGSMSWSRKTEDLLRDPRCTLHSAIGSPDSGEGELKLHGRAVEASANLRAGCAGGWWHQAPPESATVFVLLIEEAAYVGWDLEGGTMAVQRWSRARGVGETTRSYP